MSIVTVTNLQKMNIKSEIAEKLLKFSVTNRNC